MMRRLLAALLLLFPITARAATPPEVSRATAGFLSDCREPGARASLERGFETAIDLNGDGQPDYILDGNHLSCSPGLSDICGSGGCTAQILVSGPGGYRVAFDDNVFGFRIDRSTRPPALTVIWHGMHCNRAGSEGCQQRMSWNGQAFAIGGVPIKPPVSNASVAPAMPPVAVPAAASWALRPVAGQSPQAFIPGQGPLQTVTISCVQGTPYGTVELRQRQGGGGVVLAAAGSNRIELQARWTPQFPNVYVLDLTGSALPQLLMSTGGSLALSVNGASLGAVPLTGAAASVRTALAPCLR